MEESFSAETALDLTEITCFAIVERRRRPDEARRREVRQVPVPAGLPGRRIWVHWCSLLNRWDSDELTVEARTADGGPWGDWPENVEGTAL